MSRAARVMSNFRVIGRLKYCAIHIITELW